MGEPAQPTLEVDPNLALEQQQAQQQQVTALQTQAQGDTAALMAQYGTRLALGGAPASAPMAVK
jgi:hypothetical protein